MKSWNPSLLYIAAFSIGNVIRIEMRNATKFYRHKTPQFRHTVFNPFTADPVKALRFAIPV